MAVMVRVLDLILHIRGCRIIEKSCGYTLQPHEHQEWNEKGKMDCTDVLDSTNQRQCFGPSAIELGGGLRVRVQRRVMYSGYS